MIKTVKIPYNVTGTDSCQCCVDPADIVSKQNIVSATGLNRRRLALLVTGTALFLSTLLLRMEPWAEFGLYLLSYLLIGGPVLIKAFGNIMRGRVFDENFLMTIATLGAFAIAEYPEAVAVMLFYRIGELFQDAAVGRSRRSIAALMDIRPDYANLERGETVLRADPKDVRIGASILVKPGEKVPLDGTVTQGRAALNVSALTGESMPVHASVGSEVLSGSINMNGLLTIQVTKAYCDSTVTRILDMVQNAAAKKSRTENFITRFARYYTPAVVAAALALAVIPPLFITGATFDEWIYRALVFLVISCPCALVISIPLGFFGGIGGASRNGILMKGGNYLEALSRVDTVVFDKTGTLTQGVFKVTKIESFGDLEKDSLLAYAAHAESFSGHPVAMAVLDAYGKPVDKAAITGYEEIVGNGIKAIVDGKTVIIGSDKMMAAERIAFRPPDVDGTVIFIAIDGHCKGYIVVSDQVKDDSKEAVQQLKTLGVKRTVILTGDNMQTAANTAREVGIDEVYAGLLPDQKVDMLEKLNAQRTTKGRLVFVGDGINDAPVLARADVGVAMGGIGSDAAIEAADVVLMTDQLSKLAGAIRIAKRTRGIVWQNIICAFVVKAVVLLLGAGGIATMWAAVFADVGVALLAILNAMRVRMKDV